MPTEPTGAIEKTAGCGRWLSPAGSTARWADSSVLSILQVTVGRGPISRALSLLYHALAGIVGPRLLGPASICWARILLAKAVASLLGSGPKEVELCCEEPWPRAGLSCS